MSEPFDLSRAIKNSSKITDVFGYWPDFHDAEVHSVVLTRDLKTSRALSDGLPSFDIKLHFWHMSGDVEQSVLWGATKRTMATLRFSEIEELLLEGFDFQNAIFTLSIEPVIAEGADSTDIRKSLRMRVEIEPANGLSASFTCRSVEVLAAEPFVLPNH